MKKYFKKIAISIGVFITFVLLMLKGKSKKTIITDYKIDENKNTIKLVDDNVKIIEKEKKETKTLIEKTEKQLNDLEVKKKDTKSAIKKAKAFKNKYKQK